VTDFSFSDALSEVGRSLVIQSPVLLVWLVGIVVALIRWPKSPMVSGLALLAFGLHLIIRVGALIAWAFIPRLVFDSDSLAEHSEVIFPAMGVVFNSLHAVAWVILLFALFVGRSAPAVTRPG